MVRLKVMEEGQETNYETGFNSTMVRLKEARRVKNWTRRVMFQFHNGSIKSLQVAIETETDSEFQFHNGSIKR